MMSWAVRGTRCRGCGRVRREGRSLEQREARRTVRRRRRGEAHAFCGEAVDVGRLDLLLAVAAKVAVAEVVGHDEDDVGLGGGADLGC